jgi:hypothetical protein
MRVDFGAREVAPDEPAPIHNFSVFDSRHLNRAMDVAAELMRLADSAPNEDGLAAALDHYEGLGGQENPDLVDYALMVFITHHAKGRALTHSIPAVTLRNPERRRAVSRAGQGRNTSGARKAHCANP